MAHKQNLKWQQYKNSENYVSPNPSHVSGSKRKFKRSKIKKQWGTWKKLFIQMGGTATMFKKDRTHATLSTIEAVKAQQKDA